MPSTKYSIDQYVSCAYLSPYCAFTAFLSFTSIPSSHVEVMADLGWHVAIDEEIHAL